jgi:hypothetical protein
MWLKFDLTDGEIDQLCMKAGHHEKIPELIDYYRNLRRHIFTNLDFIVDKFIHHDSCDEPHGWRDTPETPSTGSPRATSPTPPPGTEGRFPNSPTTLQIRSSRVITEEYVRKAWQFINILDDNVWAENSTEAALILAANRTATDVKYRAKSIYLGEPMELKEKTRM